MNPGTLFIKINSKNNREVILRAPKKEDRKDLRTLINELVKEEALIGRDTLVSKEQQVYRHEKLIENVKKGKVIAVVSEVDGKVIGFTMAEPRFGRLKHVASFGISIRKEFRSQGIGSKMIEELENQVKSKGIEIMILEVYANNLSRRLYKKLGYEEYGILPYGIKYHGEYIDCVSMYKRLP